MNSQNGFAKFLNFTEIFDCTGHSVPVVVNYPDTVSAQLLNTRTHVLHEYLCENEKVRETVFACSYGLWSPGRIFKAKKWSKISVHCPFKCAVLDVRCGGLAVKCDGLILRCGLVVK